MICDRCRCYNRIFCDPPRTSGWHSGQGTTFKVFKLDFESYERYLDFETRVLHRISIQNALTDANIVVWPGQPFWKTHKMWGNIHTALFFHLGHVQQIQELYGGRKPPEAQRPRQQGARFPGFRSGNISSISRSSNDQNGSFAGISTLSGIKMIRFSILSGYHVVNMVRFPTFPSSQVVKPIRSPIFWGSQVVKIVCFPNKKIWRCFKYHSNHKIWR